VRYAGSLGELHLRPAPLVAQSLQLLAHIYVCQKLFVYRRGCLPSLRFSQTNVSNGRFSCQYAVELIHASKAGSVADLLVTVGEMELIEAWMVQRWLGDLWAEGGYIGEGESLKFG
jgi:hypothetical protein